MFDKVREYIKDDEFRLTLFNDRIHIINYLEILALNSKYISVDTGNNLITIKGYDLVLNKLLDNEILVTGKIVSVEEIYD